MLRTTRLVMRGWLVALLVCVTAPACNSQDANAPRAGKRILFIGNSLTYVNNLPGMVAALGRLTDDTLSVETVASANYALIDHYNGGSRALGELQSSRWDVVVLQQGPSTTPVNRDSLILVAKLFEPLIRNAGATPALYMVWPTVDRKAFFDAARVSYQMAADEVNGIFIPAGAAWATAWATDPNLPLYDPDGLHASPLGTYLAALVIYERLTGKDARQLPGTAIPGVSAPEATVRLLQRAAHETNSLYPP
jgi:hypothetical protein